MRVFLQLPFSLHNWFDTFFSFPVCDRIFVVNFWNCSVSFFQGFGYRVCEEARMSVLVFLVELITPLSSDSEKGGSDFLSNFPFHRLFCFCSEREVPIHLA